MKYGKISDEQARHKSRKTHGTQRFTNLPQLIKNAKKRGEAIQIKINFSEDANWRNLQTA